MKIVITGPKGAGKTSVGQALSALTGFQMVDTDALIEELHEQEDGHRITCREIFAEHGEETFRRLEEEAAALAAARDWHLVITGGSIMLNPESRRRLRANSILVYLIASTPVLWERATHNGIPPWLEGDDGHARFDREVEFRDEVLRPFADIVMDTNQATAEEAAERLLARLTEEMAVRMQAANTYGEVIRVSTFGESHGPAIGAVLDGIQPGIEIAPETIQRELDRRKPGQSKLTTRRKEADQVHILSGVFEGKTTGAPIAMVVYSSDQKPKHYDGIKDVFRPGHADFTFYRKYGLRDYRGGGRSSGRETSARVACGAVARQILAERGVQITAHAVEIGGVKASACDYGVIEKNPARCADPEAAAEMEKAILAAREDNDSVGGIVQLDILGVPPGLGDPVFGKLDARLCSAIMTIGAVKGVEVGLGFRLVSMRGSEANDNMADGGFLTNHAGGMLGGISSGQPILMRVAVKPTSSIARPQRTLGLSGQNTTIEVHGRHDPCIVPRIIPVIESMAALALLDMWEIQSRLRPDWTQQSQYGSPEACP